jgi:hypothetical protein
MSNLLNILVKIRVVMNDGSEFTLYATSLDDAKKFQTFMDEYMEAVIRKTREKMEEEGWRKVQ